MIGNLNEAVAICATVVTKHHVSLRICVYNLCFFWFFFFPIFFLKEFVCTEFDFLEDIGKCCSSNGRWGCRITDVGLIQVSIAKCCPNLASISLWGVTAITDEGVVQLVPTQCTLNASLSLSLSLSRPNSFPLISTMISSMRLNEALPSNPCIDSSRHHQLHTENHHRLDIC